MYERGKSNPDAGIQSQEKKHITNIKHITNMYHVYYIKINQNINTLSK